MNQTPEQDTTQSAQSAGPDKSVPKSPGLWKNAMKRFRKNRLARFSLAVIWFLLFVAVFADFLAYNKPLYAKYNGKTYFPVLYDYLSSVGLYDWEPELINVRWNTLELENAFWPPVRWLPNDIDYKNLQGKSPFEAQRHTDWKFWHYLGTDKDGRDVLSQLIHGTRISITIGIVAMGIASLIGLILGALAGYFGDYGMRMSRGRVWMVLVGMVLGWFYGFQVRSYALQEALEAGLISFLGALFISLFIFFSVVGLMYIIAWPLGKVPWLKRNRSIPLDLIISRIIEIINSLPLLLLIITISGLVSKGDIFLTMVIIGLFGWTGIARYTRGEMLRTRNMDYIQSARAMGFSEFRILFRHALPNSLAPVLVVIAFGVASAIIAESSLSFLGLGNSEEVSTWGTMLAEARRDIGSWWLLTFPGLAIFLTVTVFNLLGEGLREALDPKLMD